MQQDHEQRVRRLERRYEELLRLLKQIAEKLEIVEEMQATSVHWRPRA